MLLNAFYVMLLFEVYHYIINKIQPKKLNLDSNLSPLMAFLLGSSTM